MIGRLSIRDRDINDSEKRQNSDRAGMGMDVNCLHDVTLFVIDMHHIMLIFDTILPLSPNFYLNEILTGPAWEWM